MHYIYPVLISLSKVLDWIVRFQHMKATLIRFDLFIWKVKLNFSKDFNATPSYLLPQTTDWPQNVYLSSPSSYILKIQCSWGFVNEEGDFALFKSKIDKAVSFMYRVTTETFSQEHVPVWFPLIVHIFLYFFSNLPLC